MPFFIPLYSDTVRIYENIELAARNSFGVAARAKRLVEFDEAEDLMQIFADPTMTDEQWVVLAGGNNTLFTRDFEGTLICPQNQSIDIVATEGNTGSRAYRSGCRVGRCRGLERRAGAVGNRKPLAHTGQGGRCAGAEYRCLWH